MNLIDLVIIAVLAFFVLSGIYKGFVSTLMSIGAFIAAWLIAFALLSPGAELVRDNEKLYNQMLYYTEGSEYIDDVEIAKTPVDMIGAKELSDIVAKADLPYPMGKAVVRNVAAEVFADKGVITLGDYFNQTMVRVFINILVFLALFVLLRVIMAFVINGVDYAWVFPQLKHGDTLLSAGMGLIRGILAVFLIFMLLPIGLAILAGKFAFITDMIGNSLFSVFFYRSNFLLGMMPGV